MQRDIFVTADGSHSIRMPETGMSYHSHHGAIQESMHVYIDAGLIPLLSRTPAGPIHIFELGFGTGLNALLTLVKTSGQQQPVYYETAEPYPLEQAMVDTLNYCEQLQRPDLENSFQQMHAAGGDKALAITNKFSFRKHQQTLQQISLPSNCFHLIYFDAFSPTVQPELWTADIFQQLYKALLPGGVLVTYCSKTVVRRAMESVGFTVTKPVGPYGKRDMVRAEKKG